MQSANNLTDDDYKALVQRSYDLCAAAYEEARQSETNPELDLLTRRLTNGAHVPDIGCGAGAPIARTLAQSCQITGTA